jgi:hypothetical protein
MDGGQESFSKMLLRWKRVENKKYLNYAFHMTQENYIYNSFPFPHFLEQNIVEDVCPSGP